MQMQSLAPSAKSISVATCDGGRSEIPEEWDVRLNGTGSRCSGWLEMLHNGKWKRISSKNWTQQDAELACRQLRCGFPVGTLEPYSKGPEEQETCLVERRGNETALKHCIQQEYNRTRHPVVTLVCQELKQTTNLSQPTTATSATLSKPTDAPRIRLEDGTSLCSGTVELNFGGHQEAVCLGLQKWWNRLAPGVCQGASCEVSVRFNDASRQKSLPAPWEKVQCEQKHITLDCLDGTKECLSITLVKCSGQDSKPNIEAVSNTETVLGVLLGLVLTIVLLVICVPPTYKKLVKKYSKKKQHQWIGPSGVNQNVSFHRNSSVAFQPHRENRVVQEEENKAFKKNSYLSPYAALERAANRSSSPLDNSSDSDYDLSFARQL
ncbi:T-cell surface glycoprotein CD5 [Elgaria multicarinata webbii]|uniref:T-cell surface glycoprotein CD5 n=1 Tax=Elgaria multicarinata webbii TaxID=159646 RepID=UPI002FCCC41C